MNPFGRAAVLVLCSALLVACGDQTSSGSAADDPSTSTSPTGTPSSDPDGVRVAERERDGHRRAPAC